MSNEGYMSKVDKVSGGQRGKALSLSFDQLNSGEQSILQTLRGSGGKMKISAIVKALGWDKPCKVKGNSRVRNSLRRLVREGFVIHNSKVGDGTYMSADIGPVTANPQPVDTSEVSYRAMAEGRKSDCAMYNACLDQAIDGKWEGFSCGSCKAFAAPDEFQKEQNHLGLRAVQTAADLVAKHGKVNRIRGVKPGADAKRLKVVQTVSLSEVLAMND
jgi:hypothetical protein